MKLEQQSNQRDWIYWTNVRLENEVELDKSEFLKIADQTKV